MITVREMDVRNYQRYMEEMILKTARDYVLSGYCSPDEALEFAKNSFEEYLPDGMATKNQYFFDIYDDEKLIGMAWYALMDIEECFIYDLVFEDGETINLQKQFHILGLLEKEAKEKGMKKVTLHIFGHQKEMLEEYIKNAYFPISFYLSKKLE